MSGSSNGGFRRFIAKLSAQRDQTSALVRDEYLRLDENSRRVFREWVDAIVLAGPVPVGLGVNVSLKVHLDIQIGTNDPDSVAVTPGTLASAMAAWDRGEDYVHRAATF